MKLTRLSLPLTDGGTSPRSPGVHLSGILGAIATRQGIYSGAPLTSIEREGRKMSRALGLAWEDWLAPRITLHYPSFEYHLGELSFDGVIGTPDGISYEDDGSLLLHEIKRTRYSCKQLDFPTEKIVPWMWQCMGYLRMLTEESGCQCTRAVLHPMFVDGDYKLARYPQYLPTLLEFTWEEVETNWAMVQANKYLAQPEAGTVTAATTETEDTE
jgi:hypothetical protein